jgi:hypothetical protein
MTLNLEPQEVQVIVNALAKEPWHLVQSLLPKVLQQAQEQNPPQEKVPG